MKYLITGLGNIGQEYENTRHNVGFQVLDFLAKESSISFSTDRYGDVATLKFRGRQLILLKPSTYMNLSGNAVKYWLDKEKIPLNRLLVITDDLSLPFGKIRLRAKGSDGGHNGLKNINMILGNTNYARLRFGIGNEFSQGQQVNYVLEEWKEEEMKLLPERLEVCVEALKAFSFKEFGQVMTEFNSK